MSFSFRNLFAKDQSQDGETTSGQTPTGGDSSNPFFSGENQNPFSASGQQDQPPAESARENPFQPQPQATDRGSFEALFSGGNAMGSSPSADFGKTASYSVREILPFLPPALVSTDHLPLDKSVAVPMPADGSTEVKLSAIQSVCPEIFATEITPLNDSEVTLPHRDDNTSSTPAPNAASQGMAIGQGKRPSIFGSRSQEEAPVSEPVFASASAPAEPAKESKSLFSNPFSASGATPKSEPAGPGSNPFAAGVQKEEPSSFVNPFSSPAPAAQPATPSPGAEMKEMPSAPAPASSPAPEAKSESPVFGKSAPAADPFTPPADSPKPSQEEAKQENKIGFGFPEPSKDGGSIFGAFGTPPQPAPNAQPEESDAEARALFGLEPKDPSSPFSGDLPEFAKPKAEKAPEVQAPSNVSLNPDPGSQPAKSEEPKPAPEQKPTESSPASGFFGSSAPGAASPFGNSPWETPVSPAGSGSSQEANPFGGENPFGGTAEKESTPAAESDSTPPSAKEDQNPFDSDAAWKQAEQEPKAEAKPAESANPFEGGGSSFDDFFAKTSGSPVPDASAEPVPLIPSPFDPPAAQPEEKAAMPASAPEAEATPESKKVEETPLTAEAPKDEPVAAPASERPTTPEAKEAPVEKAEADSKSVSRDVWSGDFPKSVFLGGDAEDEEPTDEEAPADEHFPELDRAFGSAPVTGWSFPEVCGGSPAEEPKKAPAAAEAPAESKVAPTPEPQPEPEPTPAVAEGQASVPSEDRVVFSLRDVLLPMSGKTGIDFSNIPPSAKVRLPMALIEPQLATGDVALRITDLARHTDLESALLLKRVDPLLVVPLPQNELFHQLQDMAPEKLPEGMTDEDLEAEFSTLFASEAENDSELTWLSPPAPAVVSPEDLAAPRSELEAEVATEKEEAETKAETEPEVEALATPEPEPEEEEAEPEAEQPAEELPVAEAETQASPVAEAQPEPKVEEAKETSAPEKKRAPKRVISITRTSKKTGTTEEVASDIRVPSTTPVVTASASRKPAAEAPKKPAPKKAPTETTFDSFNIPGPLPVGDQASGDRASSSPSNTVEPTSSSSASSSISDPFAPLPKKPEATADHEENTFFDDLSEYAGKTAKPEPEVKAEAPPQKTPEAKPEPEVGISGFAKFDDLEPFSPETTMEWPGSSLPQKEMPVAASQPTEEAESTGFFDELEAESTAPEEEAPVEAKQPEPAPTPAPPVSAAPAPAPQPKAEPAPIPTPAPQKPAAAAPAMANRGSLRDIELRAVFGTNEEFTFRRVADLTAQLPGVDACAIVGPGMVVQAPRGKEAIDLASRAGSLVKSARDLAEATGMANSETFTFHTEQGVISIFTHEDCCLTICHTDGQFDPGVREKLILVARGLTGLES